ncbi:MAG TPA: site-specific integrase [Pyrinomonadaceae bacterium]|nr:site-specific integrase [Pyrinomonadaceae bacterium]
MRQFPRHARTRIITAEEEAKLLAVCCRGKHRKHMRAVIIVAIETGMRRNEIRSVSWSNINFTDRVITVPQQFTKTLKTRLVPITDRLRSVLLDLRHKMRHDAVVFGPADFKTAWKGACRDAGVDDATFHDLRHTAITRMLEANIPDRLVMKISGHTQERTFMRYINQTKQSITDIARRLDQHAGELPAAILAPTTAPNVAPFPAPFTNTPKQTQTDRNQLKKQKSP